MNAGDLQVGREHCAEQVDEKDNQQTLLESERKDGRSERPSRKCEDVKVCRNPEEEEVPESSVGASIWWSRNDTVDSE